MALVNIAFGPAGMPGLYDAAPVIRYSAQTETIDSSATSQPTTIISAAGDVCSVTLDDAAGVSVWIAFGTAPVAAPNAAGAWLINPGTTRDFGGLPAGLKVAVINDS